MFGPKLATKCLTWVMTSLALLQSLQGSALACHLGACHSASESRSEACCFHRAQTESRREAHRVGDLINVAAPTTPCKCPTSCGCRRPAQAVLQISEFVQLASGMVPMVSRNQFVDTDTAKPMEAAPSVPISAPQVCAVLCRFLI